MKKYILKQITEVTAWIGLAIIIMAFMAPRHYIAIAGVLIIAGDQDAMQAWITKKSPWLATKIEEWTK